MQSPVVLQVPLPLQVVASWQQLGYPEKPAAHWLQFAPPKPVSQEQPPEALQVPWPLHVVEDWQDVVQAG